MNRTTIIKKNNDEIVSNIALEVWLSGFLSYESNIEEMLRMELIIYTNRDNGKIISFNLVPSQVSESAKYALTELLKEYGTFRSIIYDNEMKYNPYEIQKLGINIVFANATGKYKLSSFYSFFEGYVLKEFPEWLHLCRTLDKRGTDETLPELAIKYKDKIPTHKRLYSILVEAVEQWNLDKVVQIAEIKGKTWTNEVGAL